MAKPTVDRRKHARFSVVGKVKFVVNENGSIHLGELKNLSTNGIFVQMENPPTAYLGSECSLYISAAMQTEVVEINAEAVIVRVDANGAALNIRELEHETRAALVQIMQYT